MTNILVYIRIKHDRHIDKCRYYLLSHRAKIKSPHACPESSLHITPNATSRSPTLKLWLISILLDSNLIFVVFRRKSKMKKLAMRLTWLIFFFLKKIVRRPRVISFLPIFSIFCKKKKWRFCWHFIEKKIFANKQNFEFWRENGSGTRYIHLFQPVVWVLNWEQNVLDVRITSVFFLV